MIVDCTQPTFQRRINVVNVVDQCWNNIDLTLKMKQNPTLDFQRCTTLMRRQCPTLKQPRDNVDSTLVRTISNPIGLDDYGFVNRWRVFILLNNKIFLLTIQLPKKFTNNLLVHIVIHNGSKMVTYSEASNIAFKTTKPLWKIWKCKINILYILKKPSLTGERMTHSTA